jgi:hypothetical protein
MIQIDPHRLRKFIFRLESDAAGGKTQLGSFGPERFDIRSQNGHYAGGSVAKHKIC